MNLTNLFNHQKDKKGFVTVMNVLLKNSDGMPMLKLDSLKISNIAVEGNEKEIRGGLGAGLLMTYGYGRTATVEIEDAFASMDSLQYLFGTTEVVEGTDVEYNVNEVVAVTTPATMPTPSKTALGTVYGVRVSDGETDAAEFIADDQVEIFYMAAGEAGSKQLTLKSSDFPGAVTMVGHTFLIDESDGSKVLCEIEFPKFKLDPSFSLSLEGEGDASTFNFTGKALENSSNEIFKLKMIGTYSSTTTI